MITMAVATCLACGDVATCYSGRDPSGAYCKECYDEIFKGVIDATPARLFPSGHGCPLEPSDDASPWQENVIRELEDRNES